jgi:hypothetical protein
MRNLLPKTTQCFDTQDDSSPLAMNGDKTPQFAKSCQEIKVAMNYEGYMEMLRISDEKLYQLSKVQTYFI